MMGRMSFPFSVSSYSTRGGISAYMRRVMIPRSTSERSRSVSTRGLIPVEVSSSVKRRGPCARSRTSRSVHASPNSAAAACTPQKTSSGVHSSLGARLGRCTALAIVLRIPLLAPQYYHDGSKFVSEEFVKYVLWLIQALLGLAHVGLGL